MVARKELNLERRTEYLPLSELASAKRNPKRHAGAEIAASLERFGYVESIALDERTGRIVAGHGRRDQLVAAREAGAAPPEGVRVDGDEWLVPVQRGWASRNNADADAYLVASNRLTELGGWDEGELAELLEGIAGSAAGLDGVGYSQHELDELLAALAPAPILDPLAGHVEVYPEAELVEMAARYYEEHGFPYPWTPLHEKLWLVERLARCSFDELERTPIANSVASEYHKHRWAVMINGARWSPLTAFQDPTTLRRAIALALEQNKAITAYAISQWLRFVDRSQSAANFRPGFMLRVMREFCPEGGTVLDCSAGFGGRLVGFAASHAAHYVGIDPSELTQEGNRLLAADLGVTDRVALLCLPAEDVEAVMLPACDFACTSPPYFAKERYSDEPTQSWKRYETGEAWRVGFLLPMLRLQFDALKPGAVSVINIADVKVDGKDVPLVSWTVEAAEEVGFERLPSQLQYGLARVPGENQRDDWQEPVLVFRRPT